MKNEYPDYKRSKIFADQLAGTLTANDRDTLEEFLAFRAISAGTRKLRDIRTVMLQIRHVLECEYAQIDRRRVQAFLAVLKRSAKTQETKNGILQVLKRFLLWRFKDTDLVADIRLQDGTNHERINDRTLVTAEELELLLRHSSDLFTKALLMLLYETAARPQELRGIRWHDITFTSYGGSVNLFSRKTRQARSVPFMESAAHLRRWHQVYVYPGVCGDDYVFPGRSRGQGMSRNAMWYLVRRAAQRAGIRRPIYPYLLRHTRLTELWDKQVPEQHVKKFAGHAPDSRMSRRYQHLSKQSVEKVILERVFQVDPDQEELPGLARTLQQCRSQNELLGRKLEQREEEFAEVRSMVIAVQDELRSLRSSLVAS